MLRGINVGGQKRIKMDELKGLYESLGLDNIQTYIQSGNVLFSATETDCVKLAGKIEQKIKRSFGFEVVVIIRTKNELGKIIRKNPLADKDESKLHVTFLSDYPESIPKEEIKKVVGKSEEFAIEEREIYLYCPNGYGNTKLSNNFFERKLKVTATTRNWKTVTTLFEMAKE